MGHAQGYTEDLSVCPARGLPMSRSMTPEKGFCRLRHEKIVMELSKVNGVIPLVFFLKCQDFRSNLSKQMVINW